MLTSTSNTNLRNWNVDVPLEDEERREHFHQLFRYLRLRNQGAERDDVEDDLGHFNNQLWILEIANQKNSGAQDVFLKVPDLRILFHQQRHRNIGIENLHDGADFGKMLHAVPLHTTLPGLFFETEELRLGKSGLLSSWSIERSLRPLRR